MHRRRSPSSKASAPTASPLPPLAERPDERPRVLLADDHALFRAGLWAQLEGDGRFDVVGEAADGAEALHLCRALRPDVLVLDMAMPVLSGPEVAVQVLTLPAPPRVLALSAFDEAAYVEALLDVGAVGYVTKDQHPSIIREAVAAVARGEARWFAPLPRRPDHLSPLTTREHDMLDLLAGGLEDAAIAERLLLPADAVRARLASIYVKLKARSASEATSWAREHGFGGGMR